VPAGPGKGGGPRSAKRALALVDYHTQLATRMPEFVQLTGFTVADFAQLVVDLTPHILVPKRGGAGRLHACKMSLHNRTLLLVLWLRQYRTYRDLAIEFGVSSDVIKTEVYHSLPALVVALRAECVWPTAAERAALSGSVGVDGAFAAVDGTHHRERRPTNPAQSASHYSGYRHYHAISTQAIALHDTTFVSVDSGFAGARHDAWTFAHTPAAVAPAAHFSPGEALIGDGAYTGCPNVFVPFTAPQCVGHPERAAFNADLRCGRAVIERAFGQLKQRFYATSTATQFRHANKRLHAMAVLAAALLHNRLLRLYS